MSTIGQSVGGIVGAVGGFIIGGPTGALYGAQLGIGIGGYIDPPKGPKLQGPRLSDLSVQTSTYGSPIPRIYGTVPIVGNVFWLEGNQLLEVVAQEEQGGGKGGGGGATVETFTYFATFALGLCAGPIAGVRRIWIGNSLFYDAGSSDPETVIASRSDAFILYHGTDTQQPDPRIQADRGAANVPAYRGHAYIVFNDLPLADYGNSLLGAQIKVEVIKTATPDSLALLSNTLRNGTPRLYGASALHADSSGTLYIFHNEENIHVSGFTGVHVRTVNGSDIRTSRITPQNTGTHLDGWADSPVMVTVSAGGCLTVQKRDGTTALAVIGTGLTNVSENAAYYQRGSIKQLIIEGAGATTIYDVSTGYMLPLLETTAASTYGQIHDIFIGQAINYAFTHTLQLVAYDRDWVYLWHVDLSAENIVISASIGVSDAIIREFAAGHVIINHLDDFWAVTASGYSYLGPAVGLSVGYEAHGGHHIAGNMWISYDAEHNRVNMVNLYPQATGQSSLGLIVAAECESSGLLTSADIDVTGITSAVRGYKVTNAGSIRAALLPLQGAWPFDVVQSGYQIKFIPRGTASVASVAADELDARASGDSPGVQITESREMDLVLPSKVSIKYLDAARDYDTNEQYAARIGDASSSLNQSDLEFPIVLTADEAAQKAEILLYMYWLERYDLSFKLPPAYIGLEPADVITITSDNAVYEVRLTAINYLSDSRLECAAKLNAASVYTSAASGETGDSVGATIGVSGPSLYVLADVPAITSDMNTAGFIAAMTGHTSAWPSGILFRSLDGGQTWSSLRGFSGPCVIGFCADTLGSAISSVIDKASLLTVLLVSGSLSSVSEAAMLNGANHFAYGVDGRWEIIAAENCVLQGDGSYILSDLLRGRFGTEHNTANHEINDALILLTDSDVAFISTDSSSIGLAVNYRGVTTGAAITSDPDHLFIYNGVNLKPLSPVYINGDRDPSTNDWTLTWIRRTRIGGEWRDFIDAPVSEDSESYEIDIYSDATYTTLKRTITATSQTAAYTSAQQVTDFGSNQATLYVKIYQMSATIGRGYPLTTSITR